MNDSTQASGHPALLAADREGREGRRRVMRGALPVSLLVAIVVLTPAGLGATLSMSSTAQPSPAGGSPSSSVHSASIVVENSTTFAGYRANSRGTVSAVNGSWFVPAINGTCPVTNESSSVWVGISGKNHTDALEVGTDSDCQSGAPVYFAWFFQVGAGHRITTVPVLAGDVIATTVTIRHSGYYLNLTDVTTGLTFSKHGTAPTTRDSAYCGVGASTGKRASVPLADFGAVQFGKNFTGVKSTCYATIGGVTAAIGTFPHAQMLVWVTLAGPVRAKPSLLNADHASFSVTWKRSGP